MDTNNTVKQDLDKIIELVTQLRTQMWCVSRAIQSHDGRMSGVIDTWEGQADKIRALAKAAVEKVKQ